MNKTELIEAVAKSAGLSKKDAGAAVAAVFDEMASALKKGEKVQMIGFGTFEVRERAARKARNPQTGELNKTKRRRQNLGTSRVLFYDREPARVVMSCPMDAGMG